jgi:hypothetical protein
MVTLDFDTWLMGLRLCSRHVARAEAGAHSRNGDQRKQDEMIALVIVFAVVVASMAFVQTVV